MKCLIKNSLGATVVNNYVPMTSVNAATLATDLFEGTWKVFEETSMVGSDAAVVLAYDTQLQVRNSVTGKKTYLRFIAKSTKNPDDIQTALIGTTINGIVIDEVVVIAFRPMSFA